MTTLNRADWSIALGTPMWGEMLLFMSKIGWRPEGPAYAWVASKIVVSDAIAASFAAAGQLVLDECMSDPAGMVASIRFDLGKFAEIVTFAAEGGFVIRN